jgi:hypothetical protein
MLTAAACQAPPPPMVTPPPTAVVTPVATLRPLGVAVPVGSPTPTPQLLGDYASVMRPRLQTIQLQFSRLEQQLSVAQKTPLRMAQDDWRNETGNILQDMLAASADARSVGTRLGAQTPLNADVLKLTDDVDFVANEFRMAFDYDPDATHFMRAGRAEKTTRAELDSLVTSLR